MAVPTFNGTGLFNEGTLANVGGGQPRGMFTSFPNVDSEWFQFAGKGGTNITATGWLVAADLATLDALIKSKQLLRGTTGEYITEGGVSYPNCVLLSYTQNGRVTKDDNGYRVMVTVTLRNMG